MSFKKVKEVNQIGEAQILQLRKAIIEKEIELQSNQRMSSIDSNYTNPFASRRNMKASGRQGSTTQKKSFLAASELQESEMSKMQDLPTPKMDHSVQILDIVPNSSMSMDIYK